MSTTAPAPEAHPHAHAAAPARAPAVDALRGFALLGVVVVNAPFFAVPVDGYLPLSGLADRLAAWATTAFAAGKFFLIFSFLYGFGVSVALRRATSPGGSLAPLRRRLAALFCMGLLHAMLLFYGDILMLYAAIGLALVAMRDLPGRRLAWVAGAIYALAVLAQAGIVTLGAAGAGALAPAAPVAGAGYLGGFTETVAARLADLPGALVFLAAFNGPAAFAMAIAGHLAARAGHFPPRPEDLARIARRARVPVAAAAAASGIGAATIVATLVAPGAVALPVVALAGVLVSLAAPVLSLGLAAGLLAIAARRPTARAIRAFALVGENSLSGYLLHSILLGGVFLGWGLGYWGALDAAAVLVVSVAVYAAIVAILALWRSAVAQGPAEILMRLLVAGRPGPDRRRP